MLLPSYFPADAPRKAEGGLSTRTPAVHIGELDGGLTLALSGKP